MQVRCKPLLLERRRASSPRNFEPFPQGSPIWHPDLPIRKLHLAFTNPVIPSDRQRPRPCPCANRKRSDLPQPAPASVPAACSDRCHPGWTLAQNAFHGYPSPANRSLRSIEYRLRRAVANFYMRLFGLVPRQPHRSVQRLHWRIPESAETQTGACLSDPAAAAEVDRPPRTILAISSRGRSACRLRLSKASRRNPSGPNCDRMAVEPQPVPLAPRRPHHHRALRVEPVRTIKRKVVKQKSHPG